MTDLKGKCAVITGAGSGIGRGIAIALAEAGMNIVVSDIEEAAARETCKMLEAHSIQSIAIVTDVTSLDSVIHLADSAINEFGEVAVLCNNAGVCLFGPVAEMSGNDWDWLIDVNIKGVVNGLQAFLPHMIELAGQGNPVHIVNTASSAGLSGVEGVGAYTATKFAVVGLSESLREEVRGAGVGVSVLCPAAVNTGIYNSDRNRPEELAQAGSGAVQAAEEYVKEKGMDPVEVGKAVRQGILDNDFFIFTHPAIRKHSEKRYENMNTAFDRWTQYFEE